jgi:hypothetical protein
MIKLLFILQTFYYYRLKSLKYYYLDNWHEHSSFLTLGTPGTLQECDICLCRLGANIWLLAGIVHDGKCEAAPSNVTFAEAIKIKLLSACALNVYLTGVHLCLQSLECEVCCCFLSLILWRTSYCLYTWIIQKGMFLYLELHEEFDGVDGKSDHCVRCNTTVEVGSWKCIMCMFKMLRCLSYVIHFIVHSVGQNMSESKRQYEIPFLKLRAVCSER